MEAETGVMLPQAKECLGYQKLGGSKEESPSRGFQGSFVLSTPWFQTFSLKTMKEYISIVSHPVSGILLWQHYETNTHVKLLEQHLACDNSIIHARN